MTRDEVENIISIVGSIIDMPMEDFKEELVKQKVNIGVMNNLILYLESCYNELRTRKDACVNLVTSGKVLSNDKEVSRALEGLYAEMTKAEEKITYLKERRKELIDVG